MIRINRTIPELIINIKSSGISISVCKVNDIEYLSGFYVSALNNRLPIADYFGSFFECNNE